MGTGAATSDASAAGDSGGGDSTVFVSGNRSLSASDADASADSSLEGWVIKLPRSLVVDN